MQQPWMKCLEGRYGVPLVPCLPPVCLSVCLPGASETTCRDARPHHVVSPATVAILDTGNSGSCRSLTAHSMQVSYTSLNKKHKLALNKGVHLSGLEVFK